MSIKVWKNEMRVHLSFNDEAETELIAVKQGERWIIFRKGLTTQRLSIEGTDRNIIKILYNLDAHFSYEEEMKWKREHSSSL